MRQRGQNVVEWGLSIAAVAFVALMGFTALGNAQATYWGAVQPSLAAPTPAPSDFIHPTQVAIDCPGVGNPMLVGKDVLRCTATVYDVYSNTFERNPPLGTLDWILDGNPLGSCVAQPGGSPQYLPSISSGASNTCLVFPFTYSPLGAAAVGTHTLQVNYGPVINNGSEVALSNHGPSSSTTLTFQVKQNLHWSPVSCSTDLGGSVPQPPQVEIGHPIRCGVTVIDYASGGPVPVPLGTPLTWTSVGGPGEPLFTCVATTAPGGVLQFPPGQSCDQAATSYTCITDSTGTCQVVYRHEYDSSGGGIGARPALTVTICAPGHCSSPAPYSPESPSPYNLSVVQTVDQHPTGIVVLCDTTDVPGHTMLTQLPVGDPTADFGNASFGGMTNAPSPPSMHGDTDDVHVNSPHTTTLFCWAFVYDTANGAAASNNPAVTGSASPNQQEEFTPVGTVTFNFSPDGGPAQPVPGASCQLILPIASATTPLQSATQAPFASSCRATVAISNAPPPGGTSLTQQYITATYNGESTTSPAHAAAYSPVPAVDDNGAVIPGYRFNFN